MEAMTKRYALLGPDVTRMYADGMNMREIAEAIGITENGVYRVLQRNGVKMRRRGPSWTTCLVCKRETGGKLRCTFHRRLYQAVYTQRKRRRKKEWRNEPVNTASPGIGV